MHINTSPTKRDWSSKGVFIAGLMGTIFIIMGIVTVMAACKNLSQTGNFSVLVMAGFFILCGLIMYAAALGIANYMKKKQEEFVLAFMSDERTNVYTDRAAAAHALWKLVRKCLERGTPVGELGLEYSEEWLAKYKDQLEIYRY